MGIIQRVGKISMAAIDLTKDFLQKGTALPQDADAILKGTSPDPGSSAWCPDRGWEEPKFDLSIVVPAYRTESSLKKTIESILTQKTNYSFQLILVDDGSPDRCGEIMDAYRDRENVTVIHQENRGFSGARNAGISCVQGKYLTFVDSDDLLPPGALEALMSCATSQDADIVEGNITQFTSDGATTQESFHKTGTCDPQKGLMGYGCGKVYRASLFRNLQFPKKYWYEDSINAAILFPLCKLAWTVSDVVYDYFQNPQGISRSSQGHPKSIDSLYITERLLEDRSKFGLSLTQADYDYFLLMVTLTYQRTRFLSPDVKRAVFVRQCRLRERYFENFTKSTRLERALIRKNYLAYAVLCELSR